MYTYVERERDRERERERDREIHISSWLIIRLILITISGPDSSKRKQVARKADEKLTLWVN